MFIIEDLKRVPNETFNKYLEYRKNSIFTNSKLFIIFPDRYLKRELALIGREISVFGHFILVDETGNYILINFPAKVTLTPNSIDDITIDDKEYKLLEFNPNSYIIEDTRYIPDNDDIFKLFDDFLIRNNNIPFYMGYEDLLNLFIRAVDITGSKLALNPVGVATLVSIVGRDKDYDFIRIKKNKKDILKSKIKWVGLNNVDKAYKNIMSMITGNYLDKGLTAALQINKPSPTDIENVYRLWVLTENSIWKVFMGLIVESKIMGAIEEIRAAIKPDKDGYYNQYPVFALNIFNSAGEFYDMTEEVRKLFSLNGTLVHRLRENQLYGELSHPKPTPGMTKEEWFKRIMTIQEDRIAVHFKNVVVADEPIKIQSQPQKIYPVYADLKPAGPYGDSLKESLENPHEQAAFSIRSLTQNTDIAGVTHKVLKYVATFDSVPTGQGIHIAKKSFKVGIENLAMMSISTNDIPGILTSLDEFKEVSTESEKQSIEDLKQVIGRCANGKCVYKGW